MKILLYTLLITLSLTLMGCDRPPIDNTPTVKPIVNIITIDASNKCCQRVRISTVNPERIYDVSKLQLHFINNGFVITDWSNPSIVDVEYHGNYIMENE